MDYKSKLQPQNEKLEPVWRPTFESELADLRAEFSSDDREQMARVARTPVQHIVGNPAAMLLPATVLDFLLWARGRDFMNDRREWSPVFTPRQIREYLIAYALPIAHPTKIPIGMDGGNCLYVVDLASDSLSTYLLDPEEPKQCCGLLAISLDDALLDGRCQLEVAGL